MGRQTFRRRLRPRPLTILVACLAIVVLLVWSLSGRRRKVPEGYTGTWVTWHPNGAKKAEIEYVFWFSLKRTVLC